jgi:hypothetical protein
LRGLQIYTFESPLVCLPSSILFSKSLSCSFPIFSCKCHDANMKYEHSNHPPPSLPPVVSLHCPLVSAGLGLVGLFVILQNRILLYALYLAIYINSLFQVFIVASKGYFVKKAYCLSQKHVAVDTSCCSPLSVYLKHCNLSRHQSDISKSVFYCSRCFLILKRFWNSFFFSGFRSSSDVSSRH